VETIRIEPGRSSSGHPGRARAIGIDSITWVVLAVALGAIAATIATAAALDREFVDFSRDPQAAASVPSYLGSLSTATLLVWWAGAVSALLAAAVMRRLGDGDATLGFALGAGLTALLALDDGFQLHESVFIYVLDERAVVAAYGVCAIGYLVLCRRWLARGPWGVLAIAIGLLGLSVAADVYQGVTGTDVHVVEDGSKLIGAAAWSTFFARAAYREIVSLVPAPTPSR
jgi:hypothetical protein